MPTPPSPVGFDLPAGFDATTYADLNHRFAVYANGEKAQSWRVFAAAWNGLAYRLRSADQQHQLLATSLRRSTAPPVEDRYAQEQSLFVFVASAASALECFYLAAYCGANLLQPTVFPIEKAGHLNRYAPQIAQEFARVPGNDTLAVALGREVKSDWWTQLFDFRNVLMHRGTLPRQHFLSNIPGYDRASAVPKNPKDLSDAWRYEFELTDAAVDSLYVSVESAINRLLASFKAFHELHKP